jgi:1-acyl-sn-glycerol-3-phosphate acyltransferase
MIKFLFFGMIWGAMIGYFYLVNVTKVSHNILSGLIHALYYIYYKASYDDKKDNIQKGILPVLDALKIKINKYGYINNDKPTLYICNHQSYIDSLIIKYIKPEIKTIAKSDTADDFSIMKKFATTILNNWGVIPYKRGDKESGQNVRNLIKESVQSGESILIYPEGSSYVFDCLNKFYPGSFEVAYDNNLTIQPITIKYKTDIAWGLKHELSKKHHHEMLANAEHCQTFDINDVDVTFHKPIESSKFESATHLLDSVKYIITDEWLHQHHCIDQNKIYNNTSNISIAYATV